MIERIKASADSETWRITESTRTHYVKIVFDEDEDTVLAYMADHKDPWVGDGERYDSFESARRAHGISDDGGGAR